ncbi:MAG: hypothetical protein Q9208_002490 [Pyrenodesmia sp. 3 TL-2023]
MVVKTIYVTRHAFRVAYTLDAATGQYHTQGIQSPTAIPTDVPLAAYGVQQSHQLATALANLRPRICYIYSSPFYRCLQTIEPAIHNLGEDVKVRVDNGVGEWYGPSKRFLHPSPASLSLLSSSFFPSLNIDPAFAPSIIPPPSGETISQLHDRVAYALSHIICTVDAETGHDKDIAILICTHAATLIATGRCLTGEMPQHACEEDFLAPCAGISKFVRRMGREGDDREWRGGKGVCGGWDCLLNGNCDHLTGGAERTWGFKDADL